MPYTYLQRKRQKILCTINSVKMFHVLYYWPICQASVVKVFRLLCNVDLRMYIIAKSFALLKPLERFSSHRCNLYSVCCTSRIICIDYSRINSNLFHSGIEIIQTAVCCFLNFQC